MYYILLFLKTSAPKLVEKCCFEFPVFEKILLNFVIQYFLNIRQILIIIIINIQETVLLGTKNIRKLIS